jgi:23S rRNA (cytosine1962-C5)-methyltransferase
VTRAAESAIRGGHPWVFSDSVLEQNRGGEIGELAVIFDKQDRFLAVGLFDPDSPLRVRLLHVGKPRTIDRAWWVGKLNEAIARRAGLFDALTNGYRCVNGESEGWPGLIIDRYDTTLVLKLYTAAWLPRLDEIVSVIREVIPHEFLVLRLSRNIQDIARDEFGRSEGQWLGPREGTDTVVFLEHGLRFEAEVRRGQKTGFFLDQRDNRALVESLASGRDVLNAFSFTGGFSVHAARGGARSVTDVDISEHALAGARRNFELNKDDGRVRMCQHETVQADAFFWLEKQRREFDLVILDPPSLAKRESERARAIQAYERLNRLGIARLRGGGILVAASCSAHVSTDEFFGAVRSAAAASGKGFSEIATTLHAPDHPVNFLEARYLKCIVIRFG